MPIVSVQMYSGKGQREKDRLAEAITEDVVKILNVSKEEVMVPIYRSNSWKLVFFWCTSLRNNRECFNILPTHSLIYCNF